MKYGATTLSCPPTTYLVGEGVVEGAFGDDESPTPPDAPLLLLLLFVLAVRARGEVDVSVISVLPTLSDDRRVLTELPSELDATLMDIPIKLSPPPATVLLLKASCCCCCWECRSFVLGVCCCCCGC